MWCDDDYRKNESDEESLEVGETGEKDKKPECVIKRLFIYLFIKLGKLN